MFDIKMSNLLINTWYNSILLLGTNVLVNGSSRDKGSDPITVKGVKAGTAYINVINNKSF